MLDQYGRQIDYIRISLTDRCNLRCVYCMPEKGVDSLNHEDILRLEEIIRFVKIIATEGISKIKLTGGEPLARRNLPYLVEEIYKLDGVESITITTNGLLLEDQLEPLYNAGVRSINISLDTLDRDSYKAITRFDELDKVISVIDKALQYPDITLKLNAVPIKGLNDNQLMELAKLARDKSIALRFIELMPIGLGREMHCLGEEEVRELIYPVTGQLTAYDKKLGNGPSRYYTAEGFAGKIGFISAVSHSFCDKCNRIRLTADGFLKTCLQYDHGVCIKTLLREGASDEEVLNAFRAAVNQKPKQHSFTEKNSSENMETLNMSQIGG